MLALLAMLLQELRKNMLVGSAESKTKTQFVGSMLFCQLAIVVHCIPRVYVIHTFWLAVFFLNMFLQEKIDPGSVNLLTGVYV